MGVNLVPEIDTDSIVVEEKDFKPRLTDPHSDWSVESGCITEGHHRVLRFTVICHNKGNKALDIGNPANRPDIFARPADLGLPKSPHPWLMKEKFYLYELRNDSAVNLKGYKQPFCLSDLSTFNCFDMGIDANKSDRYQSNLECQFIIIDGLKDGEYTLEVMANAPSVLAVKKKMGKVIFEEDNYDDNCTAVRLEIKGNELPTILGPTSPKMI
jgi:hypothetical protein